MTVVTALMYIGRAMGMPMDMPRAMDLMLSSPNKPRTVYGVGMVMRIMTGVIFATIYAFLFDLLGINADWFWAVVFGAIHGVIHGVIAGMAFMMPRMHS